MSALIALLLLFPLLILFALWHGFRDGYSGGRHRDVTG